MNAVGRNKITATLYADVIPTFTTSSIKSACKLNGIALFMHPVTTNTYYSSEKRFGCVTSLSVVLFAVFLINMT
jgi:hypothetical protein